MQSLEVASGHDSLVAVTSTIAHITNAGSRFPVLWVMIATCAVALLAAEHQILKHGGSRPAVDAMRRHASSALGVGLAVTLLALIVPACQSASAQGALPDLISDPPNPSFFKEIIDVDGEPRLVVTFDGYVHNIGEGVLDVTGNPQEAGGMKQRVRNGDGWQAVGSPTVRFETDDGHNHFHLINAVEYVLWDEARGSQTAIGSKVGFCLVDSEQMEPGTDAAYNEEMNNFCQEGNPAATDLQMGITPGWRDNYDATTTLQWVDVSRVAPGLYWIGAITDPNDEIVESNEENNGLVYSDHPIAVPGFAPLPQSDVVDGPEASITLTSTTYGDVTSAIYTIVAGPSSGTIDVPVGFDLGDPVVVYRPDPGFEGIDRIEFSVHDANSRYPLERPTATIELTVRGGGADDADDAAAVADPAILTPPSTFFEVAVGEPFEVDIQVSTASGAPARLYARGLPTGLTVDPTAGRIAGAAVAAGIYDVDLIAVGAIGDPVTTVPVTWIVNPADPSVNLTAAPDRSSVVDVPLRVRLGPAGLGLAFEADGLPPGLTIEPDQPVLVGTPTEAGVFQVDIRQLDGSRVVADTSFTWTIRRA